MSNLELSTVAYSVHEAITVNDRPMSPVEITSFLVRVYDEELEQDEIEAAVTALIGRGKLAPVGTVEHPLFDTLCRNSKGKRCPPPLGRNRDSKSSDYGWF